MDKIGNLDMTELTNMGRPGLEPGTRELIASPYIIVYEVHEERGEIEIVAVMHGAQKRKLRDR